MFFLIFLDCKYIAFKLSKKYILNNFIKKNLFLKFC